MPVVVMLKFYSIKVFCFWISIYFTCSFAYDGVIQLHLLEYFQELSKTQSICNDMQSIRT